jgi:glycosyltransferase involved in cell wall biosynthesis
MSGRGLCVVVPALECEARIGAVVAGVHAAAPGLPVVVVDDGSHDGTAERAAAAGALVLRHPARRGKGAALATGFAWALGESCQAVATLDGDGQHDPAELPALIAAHARSPSALVVGARRIHDPEGPMPRWNRVGNRSSTFWISRFAGRPISDSQSGFRIYPRELLVGAPISRGFETESELLLRAARRGLPIEFVPVATHYEPPAERVTHFRPVRDTLRIIVLVLRQTQWRP